MITMMFVMTTTGIRVITGVTIIVTSMPHRTFDNSPDNPGPSLEGGCGKTYDAAKNAHQPVMVSCATGMVRVVIVVMTIHVIYPPLLTELPPYAPDGSGSDMWKFTAGSPK